MWPEIRGENSVDDLDIDQDHPRFQGDPSRFHRQILLRSTGYTRGKKSLYVEKLNETILKGKRFFQFKVVLYDEV